MTPPKAGRYELREEIGRGAMGVVYKGYDPMIGRTVAVKTVRLLEENTAAQRQELVQRFHTEARAAGALTHPHIVVVYDAGEEEGLFYITMEYVEGSSLQALLERRQTFPTPRVVKIVEQAASALEYAHHRNVIHRDVKPANILLTAEDTAKLTDFGTAKILQLGATSSGQIIGTPSYMSPEQVKGKPVDGRSDIFSLGVVLYELVTGEKPFPGTNVTTVIYKIVHEDPIPARELDSSVHPGLNSIIERALAKEPDDRYQSCRELIEELRNYRQLGVTGSATVVAPAPPRAPVVEPPASRPAPEPPRAAPPPPVAPAPPPEAAPRPARPAPPPPVSISAAMPPPPKKKSGGIGITLVLLGVLAAGGYFVWPNIRATLEGSRATVPLPSSAPASPVTEPSPSPPAAGPEKPEPRAAEPAPAPAAPKVEAKAPAKVEPEALRQRLEQRLREAGLDDKVKVKVAGNVVTLSGELSRRERQQILQRLGALPREMRLRDQLRVVRDPEEPRAAPGLAELEVLTDVLGARAVLKGPAGPAGECTAPCRFEDLRPGRYELEVTKDGYRPERRILTLQAGSIREARIPMQAAASGIVVASTPAGADVYVNGTRHPQPTPATIPLAPGNYRISVQKAGFTPYEGAVDLRAEELKQLRVELVERRQAAAVGWLEVRSIPPGADILLNDTNTGRKTPARLELPAGQYTVTIYLRGYATVRKTVTVEGNLAVAINETLQRVP
jgi:serine/threonine-protein kinase